MASPRRQPDALRSGRIKAEAASISIPIIRRPGSYRIYNTGTTDFEVDYDSATPIPVKKKGSLDIQVATSVSIEGAVTVDGIYEVISPHTTIRGGRFKGEASGSGMTIVKDHPQPLYRILNSGKKNFDVKVNGTTITTLKPRFSIDVAAGNEVLISGASGEEVEGIYDFLEERNPIRSGRFKITLTGSDKHKIIDLSTMTMGRASYRIMNSGEKNLQFRIGTGGTPTTLLPDQSFDFQIDLTGSAKDVLVNPETAGERIQGIYDFLGRP